MCVLGVLRRLWLILFLHKACLSLPNSPRRALKDRNAGIKSEAQESVMCDVIKIRLKRKVREVGKETSKKEMDKRRIFMTSHMTIHKQLCVV